jgi:hypothetical protein
LCAHRASNKLGAGVYFQHRVSKWLCPPSWMTKGKRYNWKGIDDWRGTIVQRANVLNVFYLYMCVRAALSSTMLALSHTYPPRAHECVCFVKSIYTCRHRSQWNWEIYDVFFSQSIYIFYESPSPCSSLRHRTQCGTKYIGVVLLDTCCVNWVRVDFYKLYCDNIKSLQNRK